MGLFGGAHCSKALVDGRKPLSAFFVVAWDGVEPPTPGTLLAIAEAKRALLGYEQPAPPVIETTAEPA